MRLYFDDNMIFEKVENGYYIVYSDATREIIELSENIVEYLKGLLEKKSGEEHNIEGYEELIEALYENKIIYYTQEEYENNLFYKRYKEIKSEIALNTVYIHLTQRCNLNCKYCYNKHNLNKKEELDTEKWKNIIDILKEKGLKKFVFTGGETLIRKDLLELVKYTKSDGYKIDILSNGTLLHTVSEDLYEYIDSIIVSLDSIEDEANEKERVNSKAAKIIENIKNIDDKYKDKVVVRSVVSVSNIEKVKETRRFVKEVLKCEHISTACLPNCSADVKYIPKYSDLEIERTAENYYKDFITSCGGCTKEIAIDSNGDIYPCQSLIKPEFCITNICNNNWFEELVDSKVTKQFKQLDVTKMEKCKDCNIKFLCGSGCRAIAYNVYGELDRHSEFFCGFLKKDAKDRLTMYRFE